LFGTSSPGRRRPAHRFHRGVATAAMTSVLTALLVFASPSPATAGETEVTVVWSHDNVVAGQDVVVTGTVAPAAERNVVLEHWTSAGFSELATVVSAGDGSFSFPIPTGTAGTSRYRVRVPQSGADTASVTAEQSIVVSRRTTTINATLSAARARAGARVFVAGRVNPNWNGRKVVLQRRVPGAWVADSPARRVSGSSYRFRVPTGWYGHFSYRVVVTETSYATQTASEPVRLRVVPRYRPAGRAGAYQPIARSWVRFNPCQPVTYRVNARQGGRGALRDVKAAVAQVRRATGLRFEYAGPTRAVPQFNGRDWWGGTTDLVVAWARPRQSAALKGAPAGVVGVGGPIRYMPGMRNTDGSSVGWILQGGVVLDATDRFRGGLGRGYTRGEIVLHELGHALGLGHVQDQRQVMYPTMRPNRALLGAGDLSGMEKVGTNRGCIYRPDGQVAQSMWQTLTRYMPSSTAFVRDSLPLAS
jgi:hypothetical protein